MKENLLVLPSYSLSRKPKQGMELADLISLGIIPSITAGARGTNTMGDVITQTVDGRNLNEIWAEFAASLQIFNTSRQRMVDLLTFPVTAPVEDVPVISQDNFEEASEFGVPKGIRAGDYASLAYNFKWYDLGIRYTWMYLAEATAAQVEALNNVALEADNRLIFSKIMKAIFNNVTTTADIHTQSYNVYPFYNADANSTPPQYKNITHAANHQHYLVSNGATVDSGDLDEMEVTLRHHGYGAQMGSTMVLLVNSAQLATIRNFRVATGSSYDFIPAGSQPPFLLPTNTGGLSAQVVPTSYQGYEVAGRYGKWLILEEDYIPAAYMLGFATGGEQSATNPVGFREHANSNLRGLRIVKGRDNDYPLVDSFYNRGFGTGVRHRGAGVVMQIKASGSYDIPADYV